MLGGTLTIQIASIVTLSAALASCANGAAGPGQPVTYDLQGGTSYGTCDPVIKDFYNLTVEVFANGPDSVDLVDYQRKADAQVREYAIAHGGKAAGYDPDLLVDHFKDIPRQLISIVRDDPKVLGSCENLSLALSGPA